MHVAMNVNT